MKIARYLFAHFVSIYIIIFFHLLFIKNFDIMELYNVYEYLFINFLLKILKSLINTNNLVIKRIPQFAYISVHSYVKLFCIT